MLNLLIVEDEETTRQGLVDLIQWESIGIRVCGTAENGLQALEILAVERVDLLLTDIYMPLMDGLQLIAQIKEKGMQISCVLLSGYNDFRYAQSAIRLGVSDFLVKPCSPKEIRDLFEKVANRILEERKERDIVTGLRTQLHENLPLVKTQLLHQWLFEPARKTEDRKEQMKKVGISVSFRHVIVIAIRIDPRSVEKRTELRADAHLLHFAAANIVQETLQQALLQPVEIVKDMEDILVVCNGLFEWTESKLVAGFEKLIANIRQYLQLSICVGVSDSKEDMYQLSVAYEEAMDVLKLRFYRGYGHYFFYHHENVAGKPGTPELAYTLELLKIEQSIYDSLVGGLYAEALNGIENWLAYFHESYHQSKTQIHLRTLALLNRLLPIAQEKANTAADALEKNSETIGFGLLEEKVGNLDTLEELSGFVYRVFHQIVSALNPQKQPRRKIQQALEVIAEQYATPGLSLADVSGALFVSSNYLSTLFKQELGINFLDYIHQYRIEKAKAMLQAGDLKIQTIAREVGYFDEAHFTRTFKKWAGLLPSQYKKDVAGKA
ncbi:response regulator [Cohnella endophytica]|uniref:Response regulator n=1 Tax=Cohnella endophytica TaxID=2419778 RepID=A0A494Y3H6_9BACL|nr:response regulator [Cohnella endophytica]RKP57286.1 response regulator [Cohnella endophytica]